MYVCAIPVIRLSRRQWIFSYLPRSWPAPSYVRVDDPHLNFAKQGNRPDDFETKARKQRDTPHVGRTDAGYEGPLRYTELVARVRQQQDERRVGAPLTAVCGL